MTLAAWPSSRLPRPLADGYSLQAMPSTVRTDMDNGTPRMRRRFTRQLTTGTLNFNFKREQFGLFDGFWRGTLMDGTAWFNIPLRNGISDDPWTVRGISPPKSQQISVDVWHVSWEVEIDQIPQLSADDVAGLLLEPDMDLAVETALLYQFVHIDYPADAIAPLGP
jgi:hypothetical protein